MEDTESDPALPIFEARGSGHRQPDTGATPKRADGRFPEPPGPRCGHPGTEVTLVSFVNCRLAGANAGRWDVDAGRIGRRHDGLTLGPAVMEMVHSLDEERPSVSLRNFSAAPARLPLLLALQVRGQQQVVDQITSGTWGRRVR
ncbi:hypothetical protein JOQ06_006619 [Pogonophryne albipinna]|uniref:Uncharacterized protein n=1 Tax=Pogonophryne albipinna TaxID=1090488 RepID=A0AAD6AXF2_9TELE|nr:hypothetical protein JOQ06_006619 [Pogonophryne albipinna]